MARSLSGVGTLLHEHIAEQGQPPQGEFETPAHWVTTFCDYHQCCNLCD